MRLLITLAFGLFLWGCSSSNDSAISVNASGAHPNGWVTQHGTEYLRPASNCKDCHGQDLLGGITGTKCDLCHTMPHSVPWKAHNQTTNQMTACAFCHGAGLVGGPKAPACSIASCHSALASGTVPVIGTCISCHNSPPNSSVFPNRSGNHNAHLALVGVGCSACHTGGGYLTPNHGKLLTVSFLTNYNSKSGVAFRNNDGTCSNVSCHGGINTRPWLGGRITPLTECDLCHQAGTTQYNSYNSGWHTSHLTKAGMLCVDCHDMTVSSGGKSHFSDLSTPAFDLAPAATIRAVTNYSGGSCSPGASPAAGSFSIGICHAGSRSW